MAAKRSVHKVAVTMKGQLPHLFELEPARQLDEIIEDLCNHYKLSNPADYALRFEGISEKSFITEKNRSDIRDGTIMTLTKSPGLTAQKILDDLDTGSENQQLVALKDLSDLAIDIAFAQEFISRKGLQEIISMIQSATFSGDYLAYLLKSFVELMDHGIESWDVIEPKFIKMVGNCVSGVKVTDVTTLQSALEILESVVLHGSGKYALVEAEVTPVSLIPHLQSSNIDVQKNAIALINALLLKGSLEKRKKIADSLNSKANKNAETIRNIILTSIIHKIPSEKSSNSNTSSNSYSEMKHQLYVLQSLLFNLLDEKRNTPVDVNDQAVQNSIQELRQIAFDSEPEATTPAKRQSQLKDFKKLGFQNQMNPAEDFVVTPPGVLALQCMMYFAKTHSENYTKVVLENSCRGDNHDLPFAHASIELTKLMCNILKVGDAAVDDESTYHGMFFTHDHYFEEFYCICLQLLNKTWKEMKATLADFNKVFKVVQDQISRALQSSPQSFDQFRLKLSHLNYAEIIKLWTHERRMKEELESQVKPILELRELVKPEIVELIKKQRLSHLVEGSKFTIKAARRNDKIFYCRLSPNHKVFHHGECDENSVPTLEQLPNKLPVANIRDLLLGKNCPHIKEMKKKPNTSLAFSLQPDDNENFVNFIAPNEDVFNIWVDGINVLLGRKMTSTMTEKDLEKLLSMEIKLRLLDTEGITIPDNPPVIPEIPPNYDFSIKSL